MKKTLSCAVMAVIVSFLSHANAEESIEQIKRETEIIKAKIDRIKADIDLKKLNHPPSPVRVLKIEAATYIYKANECNAIEFAISECKDKANCRFDVTDRICGKFEKNTLKVEYKCGDSETFSTKIPDGNTAVLVCR